MVFNKWIVCCMGVICFLACRNKEVPCDVFTAPCTITYPNDSGVFRLDEPLRIKAFIPFRVLNSNGGEIDISKYPPKGLPLWVVKMVPETFEWGIRALPFTPITVHKGIQFNRSTSTEGQTFFKFEVDDHGFVCEFDLVFTQPGIYELMFTEWSFEKNYCKSGFSIKHSIISKNIHLVEQLKGMPYPNNNIESTIPQYILIE